MTEHTYTLTCGHPCERFKPLIVNDTPYWIREHNFDRQMQIYFWLYREEIVQEAMKQMGLVEVKPKDKLGYVS